MPKIAAKLSKRWILKPALYRMNDMNTTIETPHASFGDYEIFTVSRRIASLYDAIEFKLKGE